MKRIFAIPILIFIAFAGFLYVVLPKIEISNQQKENFLKAQESAKNKRQYYSDLKNILVETESYKDAIDSIQASISGEVSLADLIGFFSQKASNNGLTLKSVAPTQPGTTQENSQDNTKTPSQSFAISLSGGLGSLENFLKDIESSARLVEVEGISLQKKDEKGLMEISVQAKVYY